LILELRSNDRYTPYHLRFGSGWAGRLEYQRERDSVSLVYENGWQFSRDAFPASLSLPLERKVHSGDSVSFFLQGLLPDNPAVLNAWGKRFHVSPRNPFDLIKHVGEDCAGGLQFVQTERLDLILSGKLDKIITSNGFPLLDHAGKISHQQMEDTTSELYLNFEQRRRKAETKQADEQDEADLRALENKINRRK